jgi:hypothetical protein
MISSLALAAKHLPDIHQLDSRQQVLWVLVMSKAESGQLTSAQISEILADRYGIAVSRQRVMAILEKERAAGTVAMTRRGGLAYFKVMYRGEEEVLRSSNRPILVEPTKALSSIRTLEEILRSLRGDIRICDAYVDGGTLDFLSQIENGTTLRLLTENVQDSSRFKRDLTAFKKEHPIEIELRISAPGQLHDRYILHSVGILVLGASLKDIGKKQSIMIPLSDSFAREVQCGFEQRWVKATKLV